MPTEKIAVAIPGQGTFVVDVVCKPSDGDDEIALRMAAGFPPGSVFSISGVKWKSLSKNPPQVVEMKPGETLGEGRPVNLDGFLEAHADAVRPAIKEEDRRNAESVAAAPTIPVKRYTREEVLEAAKTVHVRPEGVSAASEPHKVSDPDSYEPGQQWRPKDPRRKSGFTIKAVTEHEIIADDGRTIQRDRMKRYDRVG